MVSTGEKMRILIADDETLVRIGVKSCLQSQDDSFEIEEATDGRQALECILSWQPDLVITDIRMPVMDGLQLMEQTAAAGVQVRFVVLSCFDDYEYVRKAMKMGARDYILKHKLDPETILALVHSIRSERASSQVSPDILGNKESLDILKQEFMKTLVRENPYSENDIRKKIRGYKMRLPDPQFALAVFEIDHYREVRANYTENDQHLLTFSICNIVDELLGNAGSGEVAHYADNVFLLLMSFAGHEQKSMAQRMHLQILEIQKTLSNFLNLSLSFGVVAPLSDVTDCPRYFSKARKILKGKFFSGPQSVLSVPQELRNILKACPGPGPEQLCAWLESEESCFSGEILEYGDMWMNALRDDQETRAAAIQEGQEVAERLSSKHTGFSASPHILRYRNLVTECEFIQQLREFRMNFYLGLWQELHQSEVRQNSLLVIRAMKMVDANCSEMISLEGTAEALNVNPSYLSRIFKKDTGENFIDYLTGVRIRKAQELLADTDMPVSEVAVSAGYLNQQYFSKVFKKYCQMTPTEYKLRHADRGDR